MRNYCPAQIIVRVIDIVFGAMLLNDLRDRVVMPVAEPGKKMVSHVRV
jgi:hypothetical protein